MTSDQINDRVDKQMKAIKQYLKLQYGEVPLAYQFQLDLFENTLLQYYNVDEQLKIYGTYDSDKGLKNPLLSTQKDLLASLLKISGLLGLNYYYKSKIKFAEEDDSEDFIESLTK